MIPQSECPDAPTLRRMLDTVSEELPGPVAAHVEGCTRCHDQLDRWTAASDVLAGLATETREEGEPDGPALREVLDALKAEPPGSDCAFREVPKSDEAPRGEDVILDFLDRPSQVGHLGMFGPYEILEVIGRGGTGIVLKGFDSKLSRPVAVKVLGPSLATSSVNRRRFLREAQAAAAVCHEHVVTIHAVDEAAGLPYLVMQYVSGPSLQEQLEQAGTFGLVEILRIGMQTASGLAAAHAQGLVHRDIKPSNILLENGVQRVKITDFGLARAADVTRLPGSGVVAGTPQYMAPEQARGEGVDHRSDLFSLGSVLYAMCTGRPPFQAIATPELLRRVSEETPSPVRDANPEIPVWLETLIGRLHAKEPADRIQTAVEVADLLGRCLAHVQQPDRTPLPAELLPRREMRRRWVVATAVLIALAIGLGASEATGLSKLSELVATVLRIRTPEGTLVVQIDDSDTKLSIDGQEIVLTGAGPQEIRLKPGMHRLLASKPGIGEKVQLVSITRGKTEIATISLEPVASPEATVRAEAEGDGIAQRLRAAEADLARAERAVRAGADIPDVRRLRLLVEGLKRELAGRKTAQRSPNEILYGTAKQASPQPDLAASDTLPLTLRATLRHNFEVWAVGFSPDGASFAVAAGDAVRFHENSDVQREVRALQGHQGGVTTFAFSPDGRVIATGSYDRTVRLWDTASAKQRAVLRHDGDTVSSVAYSPDGRNVAATDVGGAAGIWEVESGRLVHELPRQPLPLNVVRFSRDGKTLATGAGDFRLNDPPGEVKLWDVGTGKERATLRGNRFNVWAVEFSPDGKTLAASDSGRPNIHPPGARLWDLARLTDAGTVSGNGLSGVNSLAFAPDGKVLALGHWSGQMSFIGCPEVRRFAIVPTHDDIVFSLAFSPDGKHLITGSKDRTVKLWSFDASSSLAE